MTLKWRCWGPFAQAPSLLEPSRKAFTRKWQQAQMWTMKTKGRWEFVKQRKQQMQRPQDRREYRAFKKLKQSPEWLESREEREKTEKNGHMGQIRWGLTSYKNSALYPNKSQQHCSMLCSKKAFSGLSCKAVILDVCEEQTKQIQRGWLRNVSKKSGERWWQLELGSPKAHCLKCSHHRQAVVIMWPDEILS